MWYVARDEWRVCDSDGDSSRGAPVDALRTRTIEPTIKFTSLMESTCLSVPNETFTIIDTRIGLNSLQRGHIDLKFQAEGVVPHKSFLHV